MHPGLARLLAATDLDDLAAAADDLLEPDSLAPEDEAVLVETIAAWNDQQALANLLMYPQLIAPDFRVAALERGLHETGYLRLAAAVGVDRISGAEVPAEVRHRLARTLLDVIAEDTGLTAERASVSVRAVLSSGDAPDLAAAVLHPSAVVRQNLTQALFELTAAAGVRALLDEPGFLEADLRAAIRARLLEDGVDLDDPSDEQRFPFVLSYVPSLADWRP